MKQSDDMVVKTSGSIEKADTKARTSRWIEDDEYKPAAPKKKGPYIQVCVIISLCLVVLSVLAFLAYKYIFITEPEGVVWSWHSDEEDVDWYFEFKDDVFKAYFGSFEITSNYSKEKTEDSESMITLSDESLLGQTVGCLYFGTPIDYSVSGLRISGDQVLSLKDPFQETDYDLNQSKMPECPLELPDNFTEDPNLTGEWVNVLSSQFEKQTYTFNDDGSMSLVVNYMMDNKNFLEIRRNCSYTVQNKEINITWVSKDPMVHNTEYTIKDGVLIIDGGYYRRVDKKATPDQQ